MVPRSRHYPAALLDLLWAILAEDTALRPYKVEELLDLLAEAPEAHADPRLSELHRRRSDLTQWQDIKPLPTCAPTGCGQPKHPPPNLHDRWGFSFERKMPRARTPGRPAPI
jgi:hypothetical protein